MAVSASELSQAVLGQEVDVLARWLAVFTAVVVLGLMMEYGAALAKKLNTYSPGPRSRERHKPRFLWVSLWAAFGGISVVSGVAGELYIEVLASRAETSLRQKADENLKLAVTKAGDAADSASRAKDSADNAEIASSGAVILAQSAHREADSFKKEIAGAKKQAREAESQVEEALLRAKQVEQAIAWRHLSPGQVEKIRSAIPPSLVGLKVEVHHLISDAEAQQYASEIADALKPKLNAGETTGYLSPWGKIPNGVAIFLARPDTPGGADLQRALKAGGIDARWGLLSDWQISSPSGIVVFVWPKPR
jgi:hypothetical protein